MEERRARRPPPCRIQPLFTETQAWASDVGSNRGHAVKVQRWLSRIAPVHRENRFLQSPRTRFIATASNKALNVVFPSGEIISDEVTSQKPRSARNVDCLHSNEFSWPSTPVRQRRHPCKTPLRLPTGSLSWFLAILPSSVRGELGRTRISRGCLKSARRCRHVRGIVPLAGSGSTVPPSSSSTKAIGAPPGNALSSQSAIPNSRRARGPGRAEGGPAERTGMRGGTTLTKTFPCGVVCL